MVIVNVYSVLGIRKKEGIMGSVKTVKHQGFFSECSIVLSVALDFLRLLLLQASVLILFCFFLSQLQ